MSSRELTAKVAPSQQDMDNMDVEKGSDESETEEGSEYEDGDDESDSGTGRSYTPRELDVRWDDEEWVESNKMVMGCRAWGIDTRYDARLAYALAGGRTYWSGHFCKDYLFHVQNEHPLLSCFCCHPKHPYSKKERWAVVFIGSSLTVCGTLICRSFLDSWGISDFTKQVVILAFITTPVCIVELMLAQLAIMDVKCKQSETEDDRGRDCGCCGSMFRCCCWSCYRCSVECEHFFFCMMLMGAFSTLICCFFYIWYEEIPGMELAEIFYSSRIQAYLSWFLIDFVKPCCGFPCRWNSEAKAQQARKERRAEEEGNEEFSNEVDESEYQPPTVLNQLCSTCICFIVILALLIYAWTMAPDEVQDKIHEKVHEHDHEHED